MLLIGLHLTYIKSWRRKPVGLHARLRWAGEEARPRWLFAYFFLDHCELTGLQTKFVA